MPRRLQLLWVPLLAALVAVPLALRASEKLGSAHVLRDAVSGVSTSLYSLPTARSVLALQSRPQPFRHGGPTCAGVPEHLEAPAFEHLLLTFATTAGSAAFGGTARHFPLFPTGPPAQG